ncbi:hypothetical protein CsSME_00001005 [Camellia sinensis var. sinensis]
MKFVTSALMGFVTPTLMGFVTPAFIAEVNESASAVAGFDRRILGDRRRDSSSTRPIGYIIQRIRSPRTISHGNANPVRPNKHGLKLLIRYLVKQLKYGLMILNLTIS